MVNAEIFGRSRPVPSALSGTRPAVTPYTFEFHLSLEELEEEWPQFEKRALRTPFQRLSWIRPLFENSRRSGFVLFGKSTAPFLVSVRLEQRLVAVCPLVIENNMFGKCLKWLGGDTSDYNRLILDRNIAAEGAEDLFSRIIELLDHHIAGLDAIYLVRNAQTKPFGSGNSGRTTHSWSGEHASHSLALTGNWKQQYTGIRSARSRQRLRNKFKALKKTGQITFKQIRGTGERLSVARQIMAWKTDHLLSQGRRNPFAAENGSRLTRLAIEASSRSTLPGSIRAFGLYRDNVLVAGMLAFVDEEKFYYLVSAYSPDIPRRFSVGTQLLVKTLEFASRAGKQQYDFLIGDEAYKFDWCDSTTPLVDFFVPFSLRGRIYGAALKTGHDIRATIRRSALLTRVGYQAFSTGRKIVQFVVTENGLPEQGVGNAFAKKRSVSKRIATWFAKSFSRKVA